MGLSGVQRTLKFCKYLPEFGWNPIVLTSTPSNYYAFDESLEQEVEGNIIKVYRTPSRKELKGGETQKAKTTKLPSYTIQKLGRAFLQTIHQPDSKIRWRNQALKLGRQIIEENDISVIFATAPPFTDFLVAQQLSQEFGIPFVVDYRDVWVDNPFHFYATPFHKQYSIALEQSILTHAKKAVVTTRFTKELLLQRYRFLSHDDISIISHGFDPADFPDRAPAKLNPNKFTITHSGVFQDDRTPKYFFKALASFIKKNPAAANDIQARFVGVMRKNHLKMIKKYGLTENVVCTGYLQHNEAVSELLQSDLLWYMLFDTVRSPGKLYEYFAAAKPILACVPEGVMRRTTLESKCAIAVDPKDTESIENAIASYYKLWKTNSLPRPSQAFIQQFNRRDLTSNLAIELSNAAEI